jgi:DNA invertase Pin-like site-specific DNA recombinase
MSKLVGVNERGLRVGQDHQRAKVTDRDVELIRQMHDEGMSYRVLASKFELSTSTLWAICNFVKRAQPAVRWKSIKERGNANGTASIENPSPA